MKNNINNIVVSHCIVIIVVGLGLIASIPWPYETALFPRTTGIIIEIVAVWSFISELYKKKKSGKSTSAKPVIDYAALKKAAAAFGWLAGYVVGVWIIGFIFASALYVFLYMKVKSRQNWLASIICSAGAAAFIEVMFVVLLRNRWFTGALWVWLGF